MNHIPTDLWIQPAAFSKTHEQRALEGNHSQGAGALGPSEKKEVSEGVLL